jgi:hypothetical protein
MGFDAKVVEAKLALGMIGTTDMPRMAWDALEAGYDGPGIRRLAALDFPTYFTVAEAALRLAKLQAQEILRSGDDPLRHTGDFWRMWVQADYRRELAEVGPLADDVFVAESCGQSEKEIRAWVLERLRAMAEL